MNKKLLAALLMSGVALAGCNKQEDKAAEGAAKTSTAEKAAAAEKPAGAADAGLSSEEQQVSYSIGINVGQNISNQGVPLDLSAFTAGVTDAVKGNEPKMTQEEIMKVMQSFQQKMMEERKAKRDQQAEEQKKIADTFFAENGKQEGVVTTESGLQYKVITAGTGNPPAADDTVEVHYRGTLLDGTEFDSSYQRGQPVAFPVKGVIKGWTEALLLMSVGSKWELYIPANLAYGPGGTGPIPPNAALKFEVELLSIKEKKTAEKAPETPKG